jgi:hypothetical protein
MHQRDERILKRRLDGRNAPRVDVERFIKAGLRWSSQPSKHDE